MTLDQIYMLLTDRKNLRGSGKRTQKSSPLHLTGMAAKDGRIKGRAADGSPMLARIGGKSLARKLMDEMKAKQEKDIRDRKRRMRRERKEQKGM